MREVTGKDTTPEGRGLGSSPCAATNLLFDISVFFAVKPGSYVKFS